MAARRLPKAGRRRRASHHGGTPIGAWTILHDDNHVLALLKPPGRPSVPDESGDESALDAARDYVKQRYAKPGQVFLGVVHRLDRPVGGVLVFARTSKSAARLAAQFRAGTARKTYIGRVEGRPEQSAGELEQWLLKDEEHNRVHVVGAGSRGARLARTRWRVLSASPGGTLVEFEPLTGRPHQLRLAAVAIAGPLLGDVKYGSRRALEDGNVALFAVRLELVHPTTKAVLRLEVPRELLPAWRADPS